MTTFPDRETATFDCLTLSRRVGTAWALPTTTSVVSVGSAHPTMLTTTAY